MIQLHKIGKRYRVYNQSSDRLREWMSFGRKTLHREYWAIRNVSLDIPKGKIFGLIGMNGAGKSTLLKILTGTAIPTEGKFSISGRIAALLELGTGFHSELTGRENIQINGKLLGLTTEEIAAKMESIKAFSELHAFFEQPVRTYSSGMYVRLGFSLSVSVDPDVLIIDEALSVGDAYFQQKCLKKIMEFRDRGVTILFVSHDAGAVKLLCDEVALLHCGSVVAQGDAQNMLELYNGIIARNEGQGSEFSIQTSANGAAMGNKKASVERVGILNEKNEPISAAVSGEDVKIFVDVTFHAELTDPTVGFMIRDRLGYDIFGTNTYEMKQFIGVVKSGERRRFLFSCPLNLGPGDFTLSVSVHKGSNHIEECYEWVDRMYTFKVLPWSRFHFLGVAALQPTFSIESLGQST